MSVSLNENSKLTLGIAFVVACVCLSTGVLIGSLQSKVEQIEKWQASTVMVLEQLRALTEDNKSRSERNEIRIESMNSPRS